MKEKGYLSVNKITFFTSSETFFLPYFFWYGFTFDYNGLQVTCDTPSLIFYCVPLYTC